MEPVPLPVELDAVPIPAARHLLDVVEAVLPHFGHFEVPRQREPRRRLVAEHPLGVLDPHPRQCVVPHGRQVGRLCPAEVVVVHPHRTVHLHPKLVAARDDLRLRVLASLDHAPDILVERVRLRVLIDPLVNVPDRLQRVALPSRRVLSHAPEVRPDLRLLHRSVDLVEKLLHRLGELRVPVRVPVPVVYQSILWWFWHDFVPFQIGDWYTKVRRTAL